MKAKVFLLTLLLFPLIGNVSSVEPKGAAIAGGDTDCAATLSCGQFIDTLGDYSPCKDEVEFQDFLNSLNIGFCGGYGDSSFACMCGCYGGIINGGLLVLWHPGCCR
jgi:hypothetical protein